MHRDVTAEEEGQVKSHVQNMETLISDLKSGTIYPEDIEPVMEKLKKVVVREPGRGAGDG